MPIRLQGPPIAAGSLNTRPLLHEWIVWGATFAAPPSPRVQTAAAESTHIEITHTHRVWYPTDEIKAQAVLIMILTDETRWAIVWVQQWQRKWIRWALATPGQVTITMLQTWRDQFAAAPPVVAALQSLTHPWRVRVDCFLMETLLYEEIIAQNEKGLVMPANTVPAMFIHKWSMRPCPPCIDQVIGRMRTDTGAFKKQWCRKFRNRWLLSVTEFVPKTLMDTDERRFRVPRPNKSETSM